MDRELTLTEHLAELRKAIIVSLAALGIGMAASFPFSGRLLAFLRLPAGGFIDRLAYFSPEEAFLVHMRLSFFCGLMIAFPVIAQQLWAFLAPAIGGRQKMHIGHFIAASSSLFVTGCLFAYFVLLPPALRFLMSFAGEELMPVISAGRYIAFVTTLILYSGVAFELPLAAVILAKFGVVDARFLRRHFGIAAVLIFVTAAVITPTTDIFNMLILALPMLALYEVGIWLALFSYKRRR